MARRPKEVRGYPYEIACGGPHTDMENSDPPSSAGLRVERFETEIGIMVVTDCAFCLQRETCDMGVKIYLMPKP